jgi:hypothetical protein
MRYDSGYPAPTRPVWSTGSASCSPTSIEITAPIWGQYAAPVRTDAAGHSFVGAVYDRPLVARVEVVSGQPHSRP